MDQLDAECGLGADLPSAPPTHRDPSPAAMAGSGGEQQLFVSMQDALRVVQGSMLPANADKHADRAKQQVLAAAAKSASWDSVAPCTELPACATWARSFEVLPGPDIDEVRGKGHGPAMLPRGIAAAVAVQLAWGACRRMLFQIHRTSRRCATGMGDMDVD